MMPSGRRALHARYTPAGRDGIGRLELTRPEKLNATDDDSVNDLDRAATLAARDKKARAIIVSGRGRAFCGAQKPTPCRAARGPRISRIPRAMPAPLSAWYTAASAKIA